MTTFLVGSIIEHYLLYVAIILFVAGGAAVYIYVPVFGKQISICFFCAAAGLIAYQMGYNARANVDTSAQLQKKLDAAQADLLKAQQDLKTNQTIAESSSKREQKANQIASDLQTKVQNYEKYIDAKDAVDAQPSLPATVVIHDKGACPKRFKAPRCLLTVHDVDGLRGLGSGGRP